MGSLFSEVMNFNKGNGAVYNELKGLISVKGVNIIPFVGAGLSAGIGPTWTCLLETIAKEYGEACFKGDMYLEEIENVIETGEFEGAATYLTELMGKNAFVEKLSERMRITKIAWEKVDKSCKELPRIFDGGVVTTNLDHVIEFVYEHEDVMFGDIILPRKEKDFFYIDKLCKRNEHLLLKLHGDISKPETLVLTEQEYEDDLDGAGFLTMLEQLFMGGNFFFMGCSLKNDRLTKAIREIAKKNSKRKPINFAVLEAPKMIQKSGWEDAFEKRKKELSDIGIFTIWYPHGKHDAVGAILKQLIIDTEGKSKSRRRLNPKDRNKALGILGVILAIVGIATSVFFGLK